MPYTTPGTYTNAELLAFVNEAIVAVLAGGQHVMFPGGKAVTKANLRDLLNAKSALEEVVTAEASSDSGGGIALGVYGERV